MDPDEFHKRETSYFKEPKEASEQELVRRISPPPDLEERCS